MSFYWCWFIINVGSALNSGVAHGYTIPELSVISTVRMSDSKIDSILKLNRLKNSLNNQQMFPDNYHLVTDTANPLIGDVEEYERFVKMTVSKNQNEPPAGGYNQLV